AADKLVKQADLVKQVAFLKHPFIAPSRVFHIPSLDYLVQLRLNPANCAPRSGAFPRQATIDFARGSVATQPENTEVNACLVAQLERTMEPFRRRLKVEAHILIPAQ